MLGALLGLDAIAKHWEQIAVRALTAESQQQAGDTKKEREMTKERWAQIKAMPELEPRYIKTFPVGYRNRATRRRIAAEARRKTRG